MTSPCRHVSEISLFVEDLRAAKALYQELLDVSVIFEDESSVALRFDNLIINMLRVEQALEFGAPGNVAPRDAGSRFQLSIWVGDVDAVCDELQRRGAKLLTGPRDRPWACGPQRFSIPPDIAGNWHSG